MLLFSIATAVADTAPATLRLSQSWQAGADITAYLDVRDQDGQAVSGLDASQLYATIGPQVAGVTAVESFAATDEGVLYLFLIDRSRSLSAARFAEIRAALTAWVTALEPTDSAALITFGERVDTLVAPTSDQAVLKDAIAALTPTDNRTALHQGLARGISLGQQQVADWPHRRAIVILSDGLEDAPGGMTTDEVLSRLAENPVPIYAIGLSAVRDATRREAGLATLGRFARESGGLYLDANRASDLAATYAEMRGHIRAVQRVQLHCADCVLDGNRYRLQITLLTEDGLRLSNGTDLRLLPLPPNAEVGDSATDDASDEEPSAPATEAAASDDDAEAPSAPESAPESPSSTSTPEAETAATSESTPAPFAEIDSRWLLLAAALASLLLLLIILAIRGRAQRRRQAETNANAPSSEPPSPHLDAASDAIAGAEDDALSLDQDVFATTNPAPPTQPASAPFTQPSPPPSPINNGPPLRLAFVTGPQRGATVKLSLGQPAVLGRALRNALAVTDDAEISGRHAEIERLANNQLVLRDLGSTNGTRLNGVRIQGTHPLNPGDLIGVGQTDLRVLA
ncbi:FHA domain-containing protein [Thiorhodovibrio frisius]|nr:FHA domain-containing protein [Thiorhodovibrio frisius]